MRRTWSWLAVLIVLATTIAALPDPANATFPGAAGRLAVVLRATGTTDADIYTVDVSDGALSQVTDGPEQERSVRWSPDGTHIAYVVGDEEASSVVTRPFRPGDPIDAFTVPAPHWISGVAWSPSGTMLAVLVEVAAGLHSVFLIAPGGGAAVELVTFDSAHENGTIDWSPDGSLLALNVAEPDGQSWVATLGLDGAPPVPLVPGAGPSFSPDGASIVFVGEQGTSTVDVDGTNLQVIPGLEYSDPPSPGLGVGYYPVWSPEGEEIVVVSFQGTSADIVDVATGKRSTAVTEPGWSVDHVDWQPLPVVTGFDDVPPDHLFAANIAWLADTGITKGCNPPDNTLFCPDRHLSRAETAAMFVRALDLPEAPTGWNQFTDDDATVFATDVEALGYAGITKGCNPPDNTLFCPHEHLDRGQAAAFFVRALELPPAPPDALHFNDAVGSVFEDDIRALAWSSITFGCNPPTNTLFCPARSLTRAEAAAFFHRAFLFGWLTLSAPS